VPAGPLSLSPQQIRVLGCLLEKQRTTPDAYPLSLNALRLACNQSTNRDPVVDYDEATIREALHRLERRGLVRLASGAGSRASKYRHRLDEALPMDPAEQAVMCVLMLRGAQTPGELKQRCERMHAFAGLDEVLETLERLIGRGLVARIERRPGQKEERYEQLLGEDEPADAPAAATQVTAPVAATLGAAPVAPVAAEGPAPVAASANGASLEARVARLERELAELRAELGTQEAAEGRERSL